MCATHGFILAPVVYRDPRFEWTRLSVAPLTYFLVLEHWHNVGDPWCWSHVVRHAFEDAQVVQSVTLRASSVPCVVFLGSLFVLGFSELGMPLWFCRWSSLSSRFEGFRFF